MKNATLSGDVYRVKKYIGHTNIKNIVFFI